MNSMKLRKKYYSVPALFLCTRVGFHELRIRYFIKPSFVTLIKKSTGSNYKKNFEMQNTKLDAVFIKTLIYFVYE